MNETTLKNYAMRRIKKDYPYAFIYKTSDRFTIGIPDILGCLEGKFFAIELKVGSNKPTRLQLWTLRQIEKAGGRAIVCYNINQVVSFLKGVCNAK